MGVCDDIAMMLTSLDRYVLVKQELRYVWQNYIGKPVSPRHWKVTWRQAGDPLLQHETDEL